MSDGKLKEKARTMNEKIMRLDVKELSASAQSNIDEFTDMVQRAAEDAQNNGDKMIVVANNRRGQAVWGVEHSDNLESEIAEGSFHESSSAYLEIDPEGNIRLVALRAEV